MKRSTQLHAAPQSPRRLRLDNEILVLPPVTLRDLPPDGVLGFFMGVLSLRFQTPAGSMAIFVHDLTDSDRTLIFEGQRRQAEVQLGAGYARRALWWEKP